MKKLIIDRAKWRTGGNSKTKTGNGDTKLLNDEGYMCCLGFMCNQMRIPKWQIRNFQTPLSLASAYQLKIPRLVVNPQTNNVNITELAEDAIRINDNLFTSASTKEEEIKDLFSEVGIIVEFKNEYEK